MMEYVMGVDLGTTQTKAVLFDERGVAVASVYKKYPMHQDETKKAEQDPGEIVAAVFFCIQKVIKKSQVAPERIRYISFASAMHSLIVLKAGEPVTPCITWADNRSTTVCEAFKATEKAAQFYEKTGAPTHPMTPFMKLLWLRETQPTLLENQFQYVGIKDYLFLRLFGVLVTDIGNASGTGFYNIHQRCWDADILTYAGISAKQLPQVLAPGDSLGPVSTVWQKKLGVAATTEFLVGGADGALANVGLGSVGAGSATLTIGTSGAFRFVTEKPVTHPEGKTFCYAFDENYWVAGGATNNGGIVFEWARANFLQLEQARALSKGGDPYVAALNKVAEIAPGSEGLLFYPYLLGERAPIWQGHATGAFVGLKTLHTEAHLLRSVLEGIGFNLKQILNEVEKFSGPVLELRGTGGFTASPVWGQLMADIVGLPLDLPAHSEAVSFGAALYAWQRMGKIADITAGRQHVKLTRRIVPNSKRHQQYQKYYAIYLQLQTKVLENAIQQEKLLRDLAES